MHAVKMGVAGLMVLGVDGTSKQPFHPGRKILPHLPHVLKKRLRNTPLLKPFVAADVGSGFRVVPTKFGGDPTGLTDATDALLKAVEYCVNTSKATAGKFPDGAGDAHGCTIDLDGGEYLISQTLIIPTYVSNMRIQTGSLVANPKSSMWQVAPEPVSAHATACTFPQNQTNRWCQDMQAGPSPESDASAEACEAYCCKTPGCLAWQFCPSSAPCAKTAPEKCWFNPPGYDPAKLCKPSSSTEPKSMGWLGGSSKAPFTPIGKPSFFMIQVGGTETCVSYHQGACNEDIGFPGLFLDGSHVASGIQINAVMGTTIGPQTYILNFTKAGIEVNGGHEVMIDETWLGETNFDMNFSDPTMPPPLATAIAINSNDHYISNSIVFSSLLGLKVSGAANMINGLHVWFPQNAAEQIGATAFYNTGAQNRFENCYIDCSHAILVNPDRVQWINGFTLGGKGLELKGNVTNTRIQGVQGGVSWTGDSDTDTVVNTVIKDMLSSPISSQPTKRMTSAIAKAEWTFDFCRNLPFPNIQSVVSLAFTSASSAVSTPVSVVARKPSGCKLTVDVTPAAAGTLVATVDSSTWTY